MEKWVTSKNESTNHARIIAEKYARDLTTAKESSIKERSNLKPEIELLIPDLTLLNSGSYEVTAEDDGLIQILKKILSNVVDWHNKDLVKLAYAYLYQQGANIHDLKVGDVVSVTNGMVEVYRHGLPVIASYIFPYTNGGYADDPTVREREIRAEQAARARRNPTSDLDEG